MKSLFISMIIVSGFAAGTLPDMSGITNALRSGDAAKLATFFSGEVELAILDEEDSYGKTEAEKLVNQFFSAHKPSSFSQVHKGTSKGEDSHYVIGDLVAGGKTYRIYIYLKEVGGAYQIEELRIEK